MMALCVNGNSSERELYVNSPQSRTPRRSGASAVRTTHESKVERSTKSSNRQECHKRQRPCPRLYRPTRRCPLRSRLKNSSPGFMLSSNASRSIPTGTLLNPPRQSTLTRMTTSSTTRRFGTQIIFSFFAHAIEIKDIIWSLHVQSYSHACVLLRMEGLIESI